MHCLDLELGCTALPFPAPYSVGCAALPPCVTSHRPFCRRVAGWTVLCCWALCCVILPDPGLHCLVPYCIWICLVLPCSACPGIAQLCSSLPSPTLLPSPAHCCPSPCFPGVACCQLAWPTSASGPPVLAVSHAARPCLCLPGPSRGLCCPASSLLHLSGPYCTLQPFPLPACSPFACRARPLQIFPGALPHHVPLRLVCEPP